MGADLRNEPLLVKVYFPGAVSDNGAVSFGGYPLPNGTTVGDLLDKGVLYTISDINGDDMTCMVQVMGQALWDLEIDNGITTINIAPQPIPLVPFNSSRP